MLCPYPCPCAITPITSIASLEMLLRLFHCCQQGRVILVTLTCHTISLNACSTLLLVLTHEHNGRFTTINCTAALKAPANTPALLPPVRLSTQPFRSEMLMQHTRERERVRGELVRLGLEAPHKETQHPPPPPRPLVWPPPNCLDA
eukprot:m.48626 g.48626  ORF g.48626 m.48626 type:complete len:146 (+) comp11395_c0_seq1:272-709(+)